MKLVGLTGGIGSGKSTVVKMFAQLGADVIDADQVSRDICAPKGPAIDAIVREFGEGVLDEQGGMNRQAMRKIVFSDRDKLQVLEMITHPLIWARVGEWLRDCLAKGAPAAIIEATQLIESPPPVKIDAMVVVTCNEQMRIERVKQRDGFNEEHIRQVMKNQMTDHQRLKYADYEIANNGSLEQTFARVTEVWNRLISKQAD